jgi:uncharacterized protein YbaR (Trm112 family)
MYQTTTQELLEEQILSIIDSASEMSQSDTQGVVQALAMQYELIEAIEKPKAMVCEDCDNAYKINDGRYWHLEAGVWLCDDCYGDREEDDE